MARLWVVAIAALFGFWAVARPFALRQEQRLESFYVAVTDTAGRIVGNLTERDFEVDVDGRPHAGFSVASHVEPISVVVLVDVSGSMTLNRDLTTKAAEQLLMQLPVADRARIGGIADQVSLSPDFTTDRLATTGMLNKIRFGNSSRLWDAFQVGLDALANEPRRGALVVFSDGDDNGSRANRDEIVRRAIAGDYALHPIGLESSIPAIRMVTRPTREFIGLAQETGGAYLELTRSSDLKTTFAQVAEDLHAPYRFSLTPAATADGKRHRLDVRVKAPGLKIRAPRSYFAAASSTR